MIAAGLLAALLFVDSYFFSIGDFPRILRLLRDLVLTLAILATLPYLLTAKWLAQRSILAVLGRLLIGVSLFLILFLVADYLESPAPADPNRLLIFASTRDFVLTAVLLVLASVAAMAMFALLQVLVFYKSKHATPRNFYALLAVLTIYVAVRVITVDNNGSLVASHLPGKIIFFLLVNLMVVNAFRNDWIHFLNRRQKWVTFCLGALTLAAAVSATVLALDQRFVQYSVGIATFLGSSLLFLSIYNGFTVFMVLAYLPAAGILDQRMREMEVLRELSRSFASVLDPQVIATTITENTLTVTGSTAAWLELLESEGTRLRLASSAKLSDDDAKRIMLDPRQGISGWIITHRQPVLVNAVAEDGRTAYLLKWKKNIGALLGVPLVVKDRVLGVLFCAKADAWSYDQFDRDLLQAFANQAAVAIDNARLLNESIEKERLEQEWRIAHEAQAKLLPMSMPQLPGADVDAVSVSASEVGGDYYDFFHYGDRLAVVIGDVSGKGAQAAFQMAHVKGIVQAHAQMGLSPHEVLSRTNTLLYNSQERSSFVSLIYAQFDFAKKELLCGRAGHCPVIWVPRDAPPRFLTPAGIGLGLDAGPVFDRVLREERVALRSGDVFIFYTDGVTEAMDEKAREFQEERLLELAGTLHGQSSCDIREAIVGAVRSFVGTAKSRDDYTVVVIGLR